MKKTALITGASKGIGRELARLFAENGHDLVLVARDGEMMQQLKREMEEKFRANVLVIVKDLCIPGAPGEVFREVKEAGIEIDYLVNNAGFGDWGAFTSKPWE